MQVLDISQLSKDEMQELQSQLAYRLRGSSTEVTTAEAEFWDALGEALGLKGSRHGSVAGFAETYGMKKFKAASAVAHAYVSEGAQARKLTKGQRMAVLKASLGCLADHLRTRNIPATAGVVCNSMAVLHDAVEARFPCYHAAGLLDRIALQPA